MKNSADIRKDNKKAIYRFMLDGRSYTKQQVSQGTGLSVATCNTLLNAMCTQGIVSGENRQLGEVGRSSVLYRIRPEHECYLTIRFTMREGERWVESLVFSATGALLSTAMDRTEAGTQTQLEALAAKAVADFPNLARIVISIPGIAHQGVIRHCDIPELENLLLKQKLESRFSLDVAIENDMHHKAYGYYAQNGEPEDVISLCCFPSGFLPGSATIHKGSVIQGANGIAGMLGFLPCDMTQEKQLTVLNRQNCVPLIVRAIRAMIVLLNPGRIVLTGDLIDAELLREVRKKSAKDIPPEFMPEFTIVDRFDEYEFAGMYQLAVDRKIL